MLENLSFNVDKLKFAKKLTNSYPHDKVLLSYLLLYFVLMYKKEVSHKAYLS